MLGNIRENIVYSNSMFQAHVWKWQKWICCSNRVTYTTYILLRTSAPVLPLFAHTTTRISNFLMMLVGPRGSIGHLSTVPDVIRREMIFPAGQRTAAVSGVKIDFQSTHNSGKRENRASECWPKSQNDQLQWQSRGLTIM